MKSITLSLAASLIIDKEREGLETEATSRNIRASLTFRFYLPPLSYLLSQQQLLLYRSIIDDHQLFSL